MTRSIIGNQADFDEFIRLRQMKSQAEMNELKTMKTSRQVDRDDMVSLSSFRDNNNHFQKKKKQKQTA